MTHFFGGYSSLVGSQRIFLIIVFIFFLQGVDAQSKINKIKEWSAGKIANVTVDRIGNFFLLRTKGGIKKYGPDGNVMASLKKRKPTLLEPWYHPAIFMYDYKAKKYYSYGRFFENVQEHAIEPSHAIDPYLVCPTHDNRLWIFDREDYSLKNINPLSQEVIKEFNLQTDSSKPDFIYLKEYQNLVFLQEKNQGVWVVNTLGKIITKIPIADPGNFGFFGQELYYLEKNTIKFLNLLTEERTEIKLSGELKFALVTDERILTVSTKNKISLYQYSPASE